MNDKEVRKTMNFLIRTTVRALNIKWSAAEKRVIALFESGMLSDMKFNPENELHQKAIDLFLRVPTDQFKERTKENFDTTKNVIFEAMEENNEKVN